MDGLKEKIWKDSTQLDNSLIAHLRIHSYLWKMIYTYAFSKRL